MNAFLRDLVHILDGVAYVGYLWPLWDDKRQTFADKIMRTIVIDLPPTASVPARPVPDPAEQSPHRGCASADPPGR